MPSSGPRRWLGLAVALATGLAGAYLDTRPGFDDTGLLVFALLIGGTVAAAVAGRVGPLWIATLIAAVGLPVPVAELAAGGSAASLAAVAVAAIGVAAGVGITRLLHPRP
jgi:hypothetical protein